MEYTFAQAKLPSTSFIPGAVYLANQPIRYGNYPFDSLFKGILDEFGENDQSGIESGGGIRLRYIYSNSSSKGLAFILIINTKNKTEYPNRYDENKGILTYFGDNNKKYKSYLDTKKNGNKILKKQFETIYDKQQDESVLCPILYFESVTTTEEKPYKYKGTRFIGLAYPFVNNNSLEEVFTVETNNEIENARFKFTIIPDAFSKVWLHDLIMGNKFKEKNAPASWLDYVINKRESRLIINESRSSDSIKMSKASAFVEIRTAEVEVKTKSRQGQNAIRNRLLSTRRCCELCKISTKTILVASHILGWEENKDERGNINNVMLLCSNHDKLLDRRLITFNHRTGKIIISHKINKSDYDQLLLTKDITIDMNGERQKIFKEHNDLFRILEQSQ